MDADPVAFLEVTAESRPRMRDTIELASLDGLPTLVDTVSGFVHGVNGPIALAIPHLHGDVTIGELAFDIAAVLDASTETVTDDLIGVVQHLDHLGVLHDINAKSRPAELRLLPPEPDYLLVPPDA